MARKRRSRLGPLRPLRNLTWERAAPRIVVPIPAVHAAVTVKGSALAARYRHIMRHRGHKKAIVAVAHAQLS